LKTPRDGEDAAEAGAYSLAEILSQTECWRTCLAELAGSQIVKVVAARFDHAAEWLFIGCGSSYYVALVAAATMKSLTGRPARAIPASEVLLYPELVFSQGPCAPVLISRSGQTSEVLKAAEVLQERNIPSVAVSCVKGQVLDKLATLTITLPADEQSTVMTRSFTSMLLALQLLAGRIAGNEAYCDALIAMPELAAAALKPAPEQIHDFVARHNTFADYVCLGHGPFYGLACEYALKVMEMSVSAAQFFHALEFRHGPKSVVTPHTLLIFLLSEQGYEAECDLLEEVKSLGGTTLVIAHQANSRVRAAADLLVELPLKLPELARLAPSLVPGQLLGLYTGLKKGLNPDSPRHLSRAVILNDDGSQRPENATF
jgi:glucosamine--fructose-6-phosphate aminotransferase (isomerizing)